VPDFNEDEAKKIFEKKIQNGRLKELSFSKPQILNNPRKNP